MNRPLVLVLFLLLALVVGCSNRQTEAKVKGTVTYNGKPVDKGEVVFTVEGRPPSVIEIVDGKFAGEALVGSNRVSISLRKKAATAPRLPAEAQSQRKAYIAMGKGADSTQGVENAMVEYIPPEWGPASKQMRTVEAGAANEFDFNIKGPS
jgi:hypothetical protein